SCGEVPLASEEHFFAVARRAEARPAYRVDVLDVVLRRHAAEREGLDALADQRVAVLLAAGARVHRRVALAAGDLRRRAWRRRRAPGVRRTGAGVADQRVDTERNRVDVVRADRPRRRWRRRRGWRGVAIRVAAVKEAARARTAHRAGCGRTGAAV